MFIAPVKAHREGSRVLGMDSIAHLLIGGPYRIISNLPCMKVIADSPLCLVWGAGLEVGISPSSNARPLTPPGWGPGCVFAGLQS